MAEDIAKTEYYSIAIDRTKNRMYLKLIGFWKDTSVVPSYLDDLKKATSQLSEGYTILTDVTEMITPPQKVGELHLVAQGIVIGKGLSKTAEVLPKDKTIEKTAIDTWSTKSGMEKKIFNDKEKAEAWLDE